MNPTPTIGGQFSPEAVEVNHAITILINEWEDEIKWTKIRGKRALTYRLLVGWNGIQGLVTGKFELPDCLHTVLAPNFSGVKISMSRGKRLPLSHEFCWEISLRISWEKRFTAKPIGNMIVSGKEESVYEDSAGKVLFTWDMAAPSFFRNCYVAKHPQGGYTEAITYKEAIKSGE